MLLIVGLGNPGPQYETTKHNAGFLVLDELAEKFGFVFKSADKFGGHTARGQVLGQQVVMLKPMTFMNRSGQAVVRTLGFYQIAVSKMIVIHDDLDLVSGKVKMRKGGGHGGHNGVRDIIEKTGSAEFYRIKVGIGKPPVNVEAGSVTNWVLGPLTDEELIGLQKEVFDQVCMRLEEIIKAEARSVSERVD